MPRLLVLVVFLWPALARATVPVDDFEDVSDWSGVAAETATVHQGARAGRWGDHLTRGTARKAFATPLDASAAKNLDLWCWSAVANGAGVEVVLESENPASSGSDYYSTHLVVDWAGWRRIRWPLASFGVSRQPLGWDQIKAVSFHAIGWGNTPQADTVLILDDLAFDGGPVVSWTGTWGWESGAYVYRYAVRLENGSGQARTFSLSLDAGAGFVASLTPVSTLLAAGASTTAQAVITIPATSVTPARALESRLAALSVKESAQEIDVQALRAVVPFAQRPHPRTLVDAADFARIATWVAKDAWAASARDGIVSSADDWPVGFQKKYGVSAWALPPEGGQWTLWYVCPTHGVHLVYSPPMTHTCPVDSKVWTGWPYDQVIYAWMHQDLAEKARVLALASKLTGDAGKAQAAIGILKAYADAYGTYPIHDVDGRATTSGARALAQTLDESSWLIDLAWAYDLVADATSLADADRAHIEKDLLRASAATIARNGAGESNWQSWHNGALAAVGFALDDPLLLSDALDSPTDGFEYQMAHSVSGDGLWYEGSWGYHFFALDPLAQTAQMARRAGRDLFARPALRSMYFAPLLFAQPDLTLPAFNDDGGSSLVSNASDFEVAYERYGDPAAAGPASKRTRGEAALLFGAEALPIAPAPPSASALFPDSGFAVLRAGAGIDQRYLAFKFGPHGGWHGHYDKLGFVLFGRGGVLAVDPGTQSYAAPTHATWDKVTLSHNTVVVDGKTQAEATGSLHRYVALPAVSMAAADAGGAYATARLLRTMVLAGDYVVDRFRVRATDGAAHAVDWALHGYGALATSLTTTAYAGLPAGDGYQHVSSPKAAQTDADWTAVFQQGDTTPRTYGSVWPSDPAATGTFTRTTERASGGSWSGKLQYAFGKTGIYLLFSTPTLPEIHEAPTGIRLQVWGDGSNQKLSVRLNDATGERFVKTIGSVDWNGWKAIDLADLSTWSHYLGNADGVFDPPVKTATLEVGAQSAASGALFVDDVHLTYAAAGEVTAEDFEIPARALSLRMLAAAGTTVVQGNGLGPDLLQPVPMLLARRSAKDTTFVASLEPYGDAAAVTTLEALPTDAADADEALAVAAAGPRFADALLALADGQGGARRTFGTNACDGVLCLVRRGADGKLVRLVLAQGKSLEGSEGALIQAAQVAAGLQVDLAAGGALEVTTSGGIAGELRVRAPATLSATLDGQPVPFVQDGEMAVLLGAGLAADAGLSQDAAGANGADASPSPADAATTGDAGAGSPDAGSVTGTPSGCGCSAPGGGAWAVFALVGLLRRRKV